MPRMKLVTPEMDSSPKAGQKREITIGPLLTTTDHLFYIGMVIEGHIIRVVRFLFWL